MSDARWNEHKVNVRRVALTLFTAAWGLSSPLIWAQCDIQVQSQGGAVPGAVVWSGGQPVGMTGSQGLFSWTPDSTDGSKVLRLRVRAVGYEQIGFESTCQSGQLIRCELKDLAVALGGATVVGSLTPMSVKASPIRTQVVSGESLRSLKAQDVAEAWISPMGFERLWLVVFVGPTTCTSMV